MTDPTRITWRPNRETRYPFGRDAPDPARYEPIGFPPPWPDRPWIFGVMVASADGVVAWRRKSTDDDPVLAILGGDDNRPDRIADRRLMRYLRCFGDMAIGAQTIRDQPELVQTPAQPGDEPAPALYRFRAEHGLPHHPRTVIYSLHGCLPLEHPVFDTPGLDVIVVTTEIGVAELARRGSGHHGLGLIVEPLPDPAHLRRVHQRLFAEHGVRYLDCEGGMTVLHALHEARILDEVFLTVTDVVVDPKDHDGVQTIFDFEAEGAALIAEGRAAEGGYVFRRWRFSQR
jgi:riboflavin biosynthesis pyrimidine reductase